MRSLPLAEFATEAAVHEELVERLVGVGAIARLPDGRYDSRDEQVASTAQALIDAGIPFDALAWALEEGRFGLRALGLTFSEPVPRTERTYADLAAAMGDDAVHLPAVYAALGLPEPGPGDHPRADEAELVVGFVRLWSLVDPSGAAHIRVARQIGDGTRRIAEGWLDVWDETALPDPSTQGAPTVGPKARPADPTDPEQNPTFGMAELARRLVWLVHERHVEASLHTRILGALEGVLIHAGRLPDRQERPPAIAFVDLSEYTSMTVERGDDAAAAAAERLRALAETSVRPVGGRIVKVLGDGVLLQFPDAVAAITGDARARRCGRGGRRHPTCPCRNRRWPGRRPRRGRLRPDRQPGGAHREPGGTRRRRRRGGGRRRAAARDGIVRAHRPGRAQGIPCPDRALAREPTARAGVTRAADCKRSAPSGTQIDVRSDCPSTLDPAIMALVHRPSGDVPCN